MSAHLILCDDVEQADAAARALLRIAVPQAIREAREAATGRPDGTDFALARMQHPETGAWALVAPSGSLVFCFHPVLVANPNLIVWPDALSAFVDDADVATAAARAFAAEHRLSGQSPLVTGAWVLAQVSDSRKLGPGDEGYDEWFPIYEGEI